MLLFLFQWTSISTFRREYDYRKVQVRLSRSQPNITTIHTINTSICCRSVRYNKFATPFMLGWILLSPCAPVREDIGIPAAHLLTATTSTPQSWSPTHEPRLVALPFLLWSFESCRSETSTIIYRHEGEQSARGRLSCIYAQVTFYSGETKGEERIANRDTACNKI